jgi:hypothetical protein
MTSANPSVNPAILETANWAVASGPGTVSPVTGVSQTTYTAPIPVTPNQQVAVTATANGATASAGLTLELPATTATPSTGTFRTGVPVTFTVKGMGDNWSTTNDYMFLNVTKVSSGLYFAWTNSCMVEYEPATQMVWLVNDADNGYSGGAVYSGATLQNSQCTVTLPGSASISNYVLTVSLSITFKSAYTGTMYLNVMPYDAGLNTSQTNYESVITVTN